MKAETITAVREALVEYIGNPAQSTSLRGALHRMALEARDKSVVPEQLLVVLKNVWYALPDVQTINDPNEVRLLQRVVTMCIEAYYAD